LFKFSHYVEFGKEKPLAAERFHQKNQMTEQKIAKSRLKTDNPNSRAEMAASEMTDMAFNK
jgi:hypothetical protein